MSELFLQILNSAITAGWLVLAVLVARILLKNAPAWTKCALWAIVGLRLVWPFEFESVLSLVPSAQTLPPAALYDPAPEIHTGISFLNTTINPTFTQTFQPEPAASINPLQVAAFVAAVLWLVGIAGMLAYTAVSYLRLRRRVAVNIPAGEGVYLCDNIASPFILGLVKPKIYLPSHLEKEKWDSILAHERAHIARRDHWWKPLGFLLLTVFWFHPLLWLAYILLCRDVEQACDEKVIKDLSSEEKQLYSQTLLECSLPRKWITACPLAFGETSVKQRIKAVLYYKKPALWIIIVAVIVGSVLAVCFLTEPQTSKPQFPQGMYATGEMVNEVIHTGWWADVSGTFRITDDGVLQFDPATERPNSTWKNVDWQDLGLLEEFALTEDNFDDLFVERELLAETLLEIRQNNTTAWRVPSEYGQYHYFLLQNDGTCYFMYGRSWLYSLVPNVQFAVADKQYIYAGEGAGSAFYINIYSDGTFQYYAGVFSSHIGLGDWELKDGKLYLYDTTLTNPMTFVFRVKENALVYIASESHHFMYVDVADGEMFYYSGEIAQPKPSLLWVQVVETKEDRIIGLDNDGNHWRIHLTEHMTRRDLENTYGGIWVQYYGQPTKPESSSAIDYEVTATACWKYVNVDTIDVDHILRMAYDHCLYDFDDDGILEDCIISMGYTSGIATIYFSTWENGECEVGTLMQVNHALGYAFEISEQGLTILSSIGDRFYPSGSMTASGLG